MKKKTSSNQQNADSLLNHIPDIEIIDLELDGNEEILHRDAMIQNRISEDTVAEVPTEEYVEEEYTEVENDTSEYIDTEADSTETEVSDTENISENSDNAAPRKGFKRFLNMHMLVLAVFVVFVVCIIGKFSNWGVFVDISQIESDHSIGYQDVLDQFLPLIDENGKIVPTEDPENIVVFGNAPFADDRDSEDNLANLIAKATGANVYNCSVSNSYLAAQWPFFDADKKPMDAYCFYWLATLGINGANEGYYINAAKVLGEDTPPEAQEVFDTLTALDFNTVDVVAIMYDASDYLMGHEMYDDLNSTNITQFTGNLEAGIELFQMNYPHIRIIVMSPTYAYAIDENGEYVSSDIHRYTQDVLSTYVLKQCESCANRQVSFVDNLYGTITEDNAQNYLTDHLHLNTDGRKLVAERFMDALLRK